MKWIVRGAANLSTKSLKVGVSQNKLSVTNSRNQKIFKIIIICEYCFHHSTLKLRHPIYMISVTGSSQDVINAETLHHWHHVSWHVMILTAKKIPIAIYLDLTFTFLNQVRITDYITVISWSYMLFRLIPAFIIKHDGFLRLPGLPIVPDVPDRSWRRMEQWGDLYIEGGDHGSSV